MVFHLKRSISSTCLTNGLPIAAMLIQGNQITFSNPTIVSSLPISILSLLLGFNIEPLHGFVVTPDGQDHFTLKIQTPLVQAVGDQVHVTFKVQPSWYYNGTRCTQFNTIGFDRDNWQEPQQVDMSFSEYGCCTYAITAKGGGYDGPYTVQTFVVYACDGQAGYGCKGKQPCGAKSDLKGSTVEKM